MVLGDADKPGLGTEESMMMKPYYQDDAVTIYHGDCREIVPQLGRFDLVLTDPPYGKVKGDFDEEWTNRPAMLKDCAIWRDMIVGAMKPNATLYWFAWATLAGRIEALISEKLNPLAHIVWKKPWSVAQKVCPEALRAPMPETERIIMAEHYGADNMALGESGYAAKCDEARGHIFESIRAYLAGERDRAGFDNAAVNRAWRSEKGGGGGMASHWFTSSQWALPTPENYDWLRNLFNRGGGEFLRKDYEELRKDYEELRKDYEERRKDYEELRKDYEERRRFFDCKTGDQKTDVWCFNPEIERLGHPTMKPIALISYMVRLSCRHNGIILDPFAGSGTTGRAAKDLGRKAVLIEREERYCEIAAKRMAQEVLPLEYRDNNG
jgi:site-specific DNA-methyltransferase (adenine-specific)